MYKNKGISCSRKKAVHVQDKTGFHVQEKNGFHVHKTGFMYTKGLSCTRFSVNIYCNMLAKLVDF